MILNKNNIKDYPTHLSTTCKEVSKVDDSSKLHKTLLDIGESLLVYIVGIMFGEYKKSGKISEKLETGFYRFSSRPASFGVYLSFMRDMSKELEGSIFSDKFLKEKKFEKVSEFIFYYKLLKQVIDEGRDESFDDPVEELEKGRTVAKMGLLDFYDTFITIRNTYAHPEDKAGPKNNKRKWPLDDDYYDCINPLMQDALSELIDDFDLLINYRPMHVKSINDKDNVIEYNVEMSLKPEEVKKKLNKEEMSSMNTETRYILNPDDDGVYVKFYLNKIPQINPEIAKEIINREKAKAMEPHLVEMVNAKLIDDGLIDDLEYLVLRDTAKTSSISDERLFQLIEKVRSKLKIEGTVGTPDKKGTIFVESKDEQAKLSFNVWWMHYFNMAKKIDSKFVAKEKETEKKVDKKIKDLKAKRKSLHVNKQLASNQKKLKDRKALKSKTLKSLKEKIRLKREMRKKATQSERKNKLLEDIRSLQENLEEKSLKFDQDIEKLTQEKEDLDFKKIDLEQDINTQLEKSQNERKELSYYGQWGIHKNLWAEINHYIKYLLDEILNKSEMDIDSEDESEDISTPKWINSPNQWQIGNLSYTYWGRIHPEKSPLGKTYNVGFAITRQFPWCPKSVHPELKDQVKKPVALVWATQDDELQAKIDLDSTLRKKYSALKKNLVSEYEEKLLKMGANVRCYDFEEDADVFIPLSEYITDTERYGDNEDEKIYFSLYSRLWNTTDFLEEGLISLKKLSEYEKETLTFISLFSNIIAQLNDYAMENGINEETIKERNDQYNRLKDTMFDKFSIYYKKGTLFAPTKEQQNEMYEFGMEQGLTDRLYNMMYHGFRFNNNNGVITEIKNQRDQYRRGTDEYDKYNNKIKELKRNAGIKDTTRAK